MDEAIAKALISMSLHEPEVFRLYSALSGKPQILDGDPERDGKNPYALQGLEKSIRTKGYLQDFQKKGKRYGWSLFREKA